MSQPLLSEEMMNLTLEELIEDFGAELRVEETWFGYYFNINIAGTMITSINADVDADDFASFGNISQYNDEGQHG